MFPSELLHVILAGLRGLSRCSQRGSVTLGFSPTGTENGPPSTHSLFSSRLSMSQAFQWDTAYLPLVTPSSPR